MDTVSGNIPLALDTMDKSIANYESGIHAVAGGSSTYFVILCKRTNNIYTGIAMSYYDYNPAFFSRTASRFRIFVPIKITQGV